MEYKKIPITGVNAYEFGERATSEDIAAVKQLLEINYGKDFDIAKYELLFALILEEGWTKIRLRETVKWILKNKKYPNWTIADFFDYNVKLYPYSWYLHQIANGVSADDMEAYKVNGMVLWKLKDGINLPYEKIK